MATHLISGDDESLVLAAVGALLRTLVADGDRSLMLDDFDGEDFELRQAIDAAQTPPMFTERRVVVVRGLGRFAAADLAELIAYLGEPLETTDLVLVTSGRQPKALAEALKAAKAVFHDTAPPSRARERGEWFAEQAQAAGVRLDAHANQMLTEWLGEDAGRLQGLLETLSSAYGTAHKLTVQDVRPFVGQAGGVPPWDLTDAIDRGDTSRALELLRRMMGAGERHPLQVMSILHAHFTRLLALDGSGAHDEASAAQAMGIKPGFPARKALEQSRRLGAQVARAIELLAGADLDLRGVKDWDEAMVMEVLVARLSKLVTVRRSIGA